MPHRFQPQHWNTFLNIPFMAQGQFGRTPANWAAQHEIPSQGHQLPNYTLTRQQVRAACQDPGKPVLHGYICAMAWGLQGAADRGRYPKMAWAERDEIARRLTQLKTGGYSRQQAYDLFATDPIPGLGPAYFTKLIYFFRPDEVVGYIMDQWTAKSVNLLTGQRIVRMYGGWPVPGNTGENYDAFCRVVDFLAAQVGCTGDEMEQRLFSQNGQHGQERGAWREHVLENWDAGRPRQRYEHRAVMGWVDNLLLSGGCTPLSALVSQPGNVTTEGEDGLRN
ncbi:MULTISPECIES: hypothetical protein [Cupriavidus]|uniref:8-oxoguanine DNA glycosylase OGG fold protein n=1 Tax=Cupriavidus TaxID=106589 RepID=UPI0025A87297|nr:hypothetical protein [Cupriavidus sp. TKC]GMG91420.1 hypothetical protein Cmtc_26400 [Cupriavidus sp. TKC]